MGFDLTAKNKCLAHKGYFRASFLHMIIVRTSMVAAGVSEKLVHKKFSAYDGYLQFFLQMGNREEKKMARLFSKSKSLVFKLDSGTRTVVREFAEFCGRSGGFYFD